MVLPVLMLLLGAGMIVRTIAGGADGGLPIGLVMGPLFMAAGAGRLWVERRR
jgi:hypothetical protein